MHLIRFEMFDVLFHLIEDYLRPHIIRQFIKEYLRFRQIRFKPSENDDIDGTCSALKGWRVRKFVWIEDVCQIWNPSVHSLCVQDFAIFRLYDCEGLMQTGSGGIFISKLMGNNSSKNRISFLAFKSAEKPLRVFEYKYLHTRICRHESIWISKTPCLRTTLCNFLIFMEQKAQTHSNINKSMQGDLKQQTLDLPAYKNNWKLKMPVKMEGENTQKDLWIKYNWHNPQKYF